MLVFTEKADHPLDPAPDFDDEVLDKYRDEYGFQSVATSKATKEDLAYWRAPTELDTDDNPSLPFKDVSTSALYTKMVASEQTNTKALDKIQQKTKLQIRGATRIQSNLIGGLKGKSIV